MTDTIELTAADGHRFAAYRAQPTGVPRGGILVLQEIFGVNPHIRQVADQFAAEGYLAIAPALFDRVERGVELGYDEAGFTKGRVLVERLGLDGPVLDMAATVVAAGTAGKVGAVGYCYGGALAWLAAARLPVAAAVGYYGRLIATRLLDETPRCPVILHYGARDPHIPPEDVEKVRARHPEMSIFTYPAGHGFNCDARADYDPDSAALAAARTLGFLHDKLS